MAARTGKALKAADLSDPARPRPWLLFAIMFCLIGVPFGGAATFLWTGVSGDRWNDAGNWNLISGDSTSGIPGFADEVRLGSAEYPATNIDLGEGVTVRFLQVENFYYATFKPGTGALTLADGGKFVAGGFNTDITLGLAGSAEYQFLSYRSDLAFSGNIAGGLGGTPGDKKILMDGSQVVFKGAVSDGGSRSLGFSLKNNARATFSASNTFTGGINASFSAIIFGASDAVSNETSIFLEGSDVVLNGFRDTLGSLSIYGMTTIDYRKGGEISFADSHLTTWAGKLNLLDFDPNTDSLRFGTSASSLTQEQLRMISVPGYEASSINEAGFVKFVRNDTPRGSDIQLGGIVIQKTNNGKERVINANFVMDRPSTINSRILVQNLDPTVPLVMNGTVYLNGLGTRLYPVNAVLSVSGPGLVEFRDTIAEAYLNFLSFYVRDGNVALFGSNTYTGDTSVVRSVLRMGASNVLPDRSMLVLDNGILKTAGFDDAIRSLNVAGISAIDFGIGDSDLWFIGVGVWDPDASLSLLNFDIGIDTLRVGSSAEALTDEQLSQIWLPGYTASLDDQGYVQFTAVPEPGTAGLVAFGVVLGCISKKARFPALHGRMTKIL